MHTLDFQELHRRLAAYLRESIHNGDMTERRLARITGVSQPHIHHVLAGKRGFSTQTADQVLRALRNDLVDFLEEPDIAEWQSRE
jgi:plasmid maintenance system antidote protein VapI